MKTSALLVVVVLVSGCPPPPPPSTTSWDAGTLHIGVASDDSTPQFIALPAEVELHSGAQGGFHVPVMYRITGEEEAGAQFDAVVRRTRDAELVSRSSRSLDVSGSVWVTSQAIPIFICPTPVGINIIAEELTFEVTVTNSVGVVLTRERAKTTLRCPASNASFCASICKG